MLSSVGGAAGLRLHRFERSAEELRSGGMNGWAMLEHLRGSTAATSSQYKYTCRGEHCRKIAALSPMPLQERAQRYMAMNIALFQKRSTLLASIPIALWRQIVQYSTDTRLQILYAVQLRFFTAPELEEIVKMMCDGEAYKVRSFSKHHSELSCSRYRLCRSVRGKVPHYMCTLPGPPLCPMAILCNRPLAEDAFLCVCDDPTKNKAHLQALVFFFAADNPYSAPGQRTSRQFFANDEKMLARLNRYYDARIDSQQARADNAFRKYRIQCSLRPPFYSRQELVGRSVWIERPFGRPRNAIEVTTGLRRGRFKHFLMVELTRSDRILCIATSHTRAAIGGYDNRLGMAANARTRSVILSDDMPPGAPYRLILKCQGYKDGFKFQIETIPSRSGPVLAKHKCNVKFDSEMRLIKSYPAVRLT